MEGWEAGEVGSYLTVSRNSGNVAVNILLGGPHSLGGTDDCIHGNKTHDGIYGEKKNNKAFDLNKISYFKNNYTVRESCFENMSDTF